MPEDEQPTEQPTQLAPGQMALSMTPQGMQIAMMPVPMQVMIGEEGMDKIAEEWLASHPALADKLLKKHIESLRAQKQHLALVQHIKQTRND